MNQCWGHGYLQSRGGKIWMIGQNLISQIIALAIWMMPHPCDVIASVRGEGVGMSSIQRRLLGGIRGRRWWWLPIKLAFPVTLTCTRTTSHGAAAVAQRIFPQGAVWQRILPQGAVAQGGIQKSKVGSLVLLDWWTSKIMFLTCISIYPRNDTTNLHLYSLLSLCHCGLAKY